MTDSGNESPHRWQRLQALYDEAMTLVTAQRPQFVIDACVDDRILRDQLLSLVIPVADGNAESQTGVVKASQSAATSLEPGYIIGRYRVIRELGSGGMGSVYLAERADSEFQQQVAIKLVNSNLVSSNIIARMRGERQILANFNHANIARLIDGGGTADGLPYLVMEYIEGTRIDLYCSARKLDVNAKLTLFKQVCAAVHAAHQQLIIHRDIKPSNILVTDDGIPKLLDFGIAKLLDASARISDTALTQINERMLTPEYASPEQIRGETLSTASDVYALGILLYELLTGVRPYRFTGSSLHQLEQYVQNHAPFKPSMVIASTAKTINEHPDAALSRTLRGDLDNIVMKAIHKDIARRYATVIALADDIDNYLANRPISARPDSAGYIAKKFWQRNRWSVSGAIVMVVVIVALTIFYTWRLTIERDIAQRERLTATRVSDFMTEVFRVANPNESRGNTVPVREVLDAAVTRIDKDLNTEPEVQVALLRKMAQAYVGIGLWNDAKSLLERAIKLQQGVRDQQQLELANTYTELAKVQHRLSDFSGEQQSLEKALAIRHDLHRDQDAETINTLIAWSKSQATRGSIDDAEQTLVRAADIAHQLDDKDTLTPGKIYSAHGDILYNASRYQEAEQYYRKAQSLLHHTLDQGADLYVDNSIGLGGAMISQSHLDEAKVLMTSLLAEITPLYPENHPLVAAAWNELGIAYCDGGDYQQCSQAFQKSADIEQALSRDSMRLAILYINLGSAFRDAGHPDASLLALEKAETLLRQIRGDKDPNLMNVYYEKAAALREQGKLAQAEKVLASGERIASQTHNDFNPVVYFIAMERGRLSIAKGEYPIAVIQLKRTLSEVPAEEHRLQASVHLALGQALLNTGKCDDAIHELTAAYEARRTLMPKQNWYIYESQSNLGNALSQCGHTVEAQPVLMESVEQLRDLRPKDDVYLSAAEKFLFKHEQRINSTG